MNHHALYASQDILGVMNKSYGTVHSVFNNSFNVNFGDRLVHFGAADAGLVPFGISLDKRGVGALLNVVKAGDVVYFREDDQLLMFAGGGMAISLEAAVWFNPFISESSFDKAVLKKNMQTLITLLIQEKWEAGFEEDTEVLIEAIVSYSPWMDDHPLLKGVKDLKGFLSGHSNAKGETLLDFWIGRGKGLTPSGDDFLIGMLALLAASGQLPEVFKSTIHDYIQTRGSKRTTQVSLEYLWYAVQLKFGSHVNNVCLALINGNQDDIYREASELRKAGHTSSTDTMIGILFGCQSIMEGK
ncbi:uncharacterized protein DUF2877 [Scopulibacillus darangshiensis]|uniref:Uncharacterized protein DUF2877 n=1 Tax=Scopulibacillus darangshiensis TaxID=442528 RepID=A0A4R2NJL7_9BACL|nr:DUF2877 domain-containing protein [Scopulibacillus darangshiensis]TCP21667.1 uncharacterized protein DUF2877 [Scopulibacillus darangshiensis]